MARMIKAGPVPTPARRRPSVRRSLATLLAYATLTAGALVFFVPFLWLVVTSLKQRNQIFTDPLIWIPDPIMWSNYARALTSPGFPYLRLLANPLFYAVTSTRGMVLSSTVVAYAFARMRFRGRDLLFAITLATMMLPGIVTLIPTYVLFRAFGWVGTYAPLVVPMWFGGAFNIFLLRQFFLTIPIEYDQAALVDGASYLRIFRRVILPQSVPALVAVGLLDFVSKWNDLLGPLIYLSNSRDWPLAVGLTAFRDIYSTQWNYLMASSLLAAVPCVLLFLAAQRLLARGLVVGRLKG